MTVGVAGAILLRPAVDTDLAQIHAIERASFPDPWSLASFRQMLAREHGWVTVAVSPAERTVGYSVAWAVADEAEIANLAVASDARRAGVGARLLDHVLGVLRQAETRSAYLEVRESNVAALRLYRSRGFEAAGRRRAYYDLPLEDALILRRLL